MEEKGLYEKKKIVFQNTAFECSDVDGDGSAGICKDKSGVTGELSSTVPGRFECNLKMVEAEWIIWLCVISVRYYIKDLQTGKEDVWKQLHLSGIQADRGKEVSLQTEGI